MHWLNLLGLGGVLLVLVDTLLSHGRLDALTNMRIPNPNGPEICAYVARPGAPGPHPTVIMIHEFWGLKPEILGKADALAQEGYIVVAPDLFRGITTAGDPVLVGLVWVQAHGQVHCTLSGNVRDAVCQAACGKA